MGSKLIFGQGRTIISGSAAVTSSNATPNLGGSTASTVYGQIPAAECVTLWLVVTANAGTGGANTAFVELQTSADGGTTWLPAMRFTQVSGSTSTTMVNVRTNGLGANEAANTTAGIQTSTAAVTSNFVISKDQRWVWTLGSVGQSLTFSVFAIVQPTGARYAY